MLLLLLACTKPLFGPDTAVSTEHCADLDQAACESDEACLPMFGAPEDEVCEGNYDNWNSVYAGCTGAFGGCPGAEGCGVNPDGGAHLIFPSLCLPEGWESCEYCPEG